MTTPRPDLRMQALRLAVDLYAGRVEDDVSPVLGAADRFRTYLAGAVRLVITAAADGRPVALIPGGIMPQTVNATVDDTTVTLSALPEDDHGNPTGDQLAWANDDTASAVAAWVLSDDTRTYTGTLTKAEGTVNITVTDPSAPALSPAEIQLVVGPGATSQIQVTATVA